MINTKLTLLLLGNLILMFSFSYLEAARIVSLINNTKLKNLELSLIWEDTHGYNEQYIGEFKTRLDLDNYPNIPQKSPVKLKVSGYAGNTGYNTSPHDFHLIQPKGKYSIVIDPKTSNIVINPIK